ncbi:carbonic anhydrase [Azospirillum fermentarium]|uniref:carbonic anhydrase n=1 Tax=Azospirillum fermentarium TaxID=1233114 RepID=UPI002225E9F4|nr:carbonic anhydrase [Azospirillum fermentarium]
MHNHTNGCCDAASHVLTGLRGPLGRRRFLTLAALGGGAALLSATPLRHAAAAGNVEAMVLSCMDYRLVDDTARYMDQRGMTNNYDHVILAGASLGATTDKAPAWQAAFWDHVDVAKKLHHIQKVIIIDHRDCGAYRVFLGLDLKDDPVREKEVHTAQLQKLAALVKEKHPDLGVETLLMALDGSVEACA